MLIIPCVDNAGIAAPDKESINSLARELRDEGFDLEMEGDFMEHLGIGIERRDNRTICMTQKGVIEKITVTAKIKECKPNKTPASTTALGSDAEGKPWDQNHWDCTRSQEWSHLSELLLMHWHWDHLGLKVSSLWPV